MFPRRLLTIVFAAAYVCVWAFVPGCESGGPEPMVMPADPKPAPSAAPSVAPKQETKPKPAPKIAAEAGVITGKILETMDSGRYTYVNVETPSGPAWAAALQTKVTVGEIVSFPTSTPMQNFHSKTLERTFPLIFFVPSFRKEGTGGGAASMPAGHSPAAKGGGAPAIVAAGSVEKAKDGQTIEEILTQKTTLAGKPVVVRGTVVKYNANILGMNWLHVQDGTGVKGTHDLTVTTTTPAKVGDTVLIRGTLSLDKDFGAGYTYEVILDKAAVTVESSAP